MRTKHPLFTIWPKLRRPPDHWHFLSLLLLAPAVFLAGTWRAHSWNAVIAYAPSAAPQVRSTNSMSSASQATFGIPNRWLPRCQAAISFFTSQPITVYGHEIHKSSMIRTSTAHVTCLTLRHDRALNALSTRVL